MTTQTYEDYQKQLTEIPQKIYYTWLSGFPSVFNAFNLPDNLDKAVELQHEVIKNYLAVQEIALNLALTTQKQWWDNYFDLIKKTSSSKPEPKIGI